MRVAVAGVVLCVAGLPCFAQGPLPLAPKLVQQRPGSKVPLPRPRPAEAPARTAAAGPVVPAAPAAPAASAEPPAPSACFVQLTAGLAAAVQLPPIADPNGCEAPDVVRLDAVLLADRRSVALTPPATLRCSMATAIANWVRDDLAHDAAALGAPLAGIGTFDSFDCRGRNRIPGAKLSEHGRANALDVRALVLGDGRSIDLTDPTVARDLRETIRTGACARFATVLGPGSDGYHENHVHVDLAERHNDYRICQWDVRDPTVPLPAARPAEAPPRGEE